MIFLFHQNSDFMKDSTHMGREEGSYENKSSNGGKWLFWKVLMNTLIPQSFKSWPLGDFE